MIMTHQNKVNFGKLLDLACRWPESFWPDKLQRRAAISKDWIDQDVGIVSK